MDNNQTSVAVMNPALTAEPPTVSAVIIAHEDDPRLRRALSQVPHIEFYRYEVSFKLRKG